MTFSPCSASPQLGTQGKSALLPEVCGQNSIVFLLWLFTRLRQPCSRLGRPSIHPPTPSCLPQHVSASKATCLAPPPAQLQLPPEPHLGLGLWEPLPPCPSTCSLGPGISTPAVMRPVHPCLLDQWLGTWRRRESHRELLKALPHNQVTPSGIKLEFSRMGCR